MIYYLYHHWIGGKKNSLGKGLWSWVQLPPGHSFTMRKLRYFMMLTSTFLVLITRGPYLVILVQPQHI